MLTIKAPQQNGDKFSSVTTLKFSMALKFAEGLNCNLEWSMFVQNANRQQGVSIILHTPFSGPQMAKIFAGLQMAVIFSDLYGQDIFRPSDGLDISCQQMSKIFSYQHVTKIFSGQQMSEIFTGQQMANIFSDL